MAELVIFRSKRDRKFYRGNVQYYNREEESFAITNVWRKRWAGAAVWNHVEGPHEFLVRDIKKVEVIRDPAPGGPIINPANDGPSLSKQLMNDVKTREAIGRRELVSTYLKNKKRIERLTISIALNKKKINGPGTGSSFVVRQWKREQDASKRIVSRIERNNFERRYNKRIL